MTSYGAMWSWLQLHWTQHCCVTITSVPTTKQWYHYKDGTSEMKTAVSMLQMIAWKWSDIKLYFWFLLQKENICYTKQLTVVTIRFVLYTIKSFAATTSNAHYLTVHKLQLYFHLWPEIFPIFSERSVIYLNL